jgi:microcystin-dependent protein
VKGRFLYALEDGQSVGETGGEKSHVLTISEMPSHEHASYGQIPRINYDDGSETTYSHKDGMGSWWFKTVASAVQATGGNSAHNNMPPYLAVYVFKRIQ